MVYPMDSDAKALAAERRYVYGRWDAPYWFIGNLAGSTSRSSTTRDYCADPTSVRGTRFAGVAGPWAAA